MYSFGIFLGGKGFTFTSSHDKEMKFYVVNSRIDPGFAVNTY